MVEFPKVPGEEREIDGDAPPAPPVTGGRVEDHMDSAGSGGTQMRSISSKVCSPPFNHCSRKA